jgi:hypothetical protein
MATRATYTFLFAPHRKLGNTVTFYIHYDGYPSGAACYFKSMLENLRLKNEGIDRELRGGSAEAFVRANKLAELTTDPTLHGDTQYHYKLQKVDSVLQVTAYEIDHESELHQFFSGPVSEFIERFEEGRTTDAVI